MRRKNTTRESCTSPIRTQEYKEADLPILGEVLFAAELVLLHAAPLYYGLGIPHGDKSAVVLIPAFLCPDAYLAPLHQWLARIGYEPFFSRIGFNTECPNLLIRGQLNETIEKALAKSGRRVHLIGHSLGGMIARAIAAQRPWRTLLPSSHWVAVPGNGRPLQPPARSQGGSTPHTRKACHRCVSRMLHRALHM